MASSSMKSPPSGRTSAAHRFEDAAEQAAHVFALELFHDLEEDLLHEDRVHGTVARAGQRILLDLGFELICWGPPC